MFKTTDAVSQLLAGFWLDQPRIPEETGRVDTTEQRMRRFAKTRPYDVPENVITEAASQIDSDISGGDIGQWVVMLCFLEHPQSIWNFLMDAMAAARTDAHLRTIAVTLAEHLLAHYGSMMPEVEQHAARDPKFTRMLTGVWRNRMSDSVWRQLRAIQAEAPEPLNTMMPLGIDEKVAASAMEPGDDKRDDKGPYFRTPSGSWTKTA